MGVGEIKTSQSHFAFINTEENRLIKSQGNCDPCEKKMRVLKLNHLNELDIESQIFPCQWMICIDGDAQIRSIDD